MDGPHHDGKLIDAKATVESARENFAPTEYDHFYNVDGKVVDGKFQPLDLDSTEIIGRNAWLLWTGGNERFWDWLSRHGYGSMDFLKVVATPRANRFDEAGLINEPGMREPTDAETEASYGIRFDRPKDPEYYSKYAPSREVYGQPTGIVGMRIFKNPEFENSPRAQRYWEQNKDRFYTDDAFASDPKTIKPFIVGVSCAICHASFHPLNPPTDVSEPKWENISSTIGAQYMRIREVFGNTLREDNYLYHVIDSQLPGTIDTSLIATDNINNANTMNAIFGLKSRLVRALDNPPEVLSQATYGPPGNRTPGVWDSNVQYGNDDYPPEFKTFKDVLEKNPRHVPRVLVDGSDSAGTWLALARVYLNIGTFHQQWIRTHNTVLGFRDQEPFRLADCESNSVYWHATKIRVDPMTKFFLKSTDPMRLKDALVNNPTSDSFSKFPETNAMKELVASKPDYRFTGLPSDPALKAGRQAFAKGCIACHSSKQPDGTVDSNWAKPLDMKDLWRLTQGDGELPEAYAKWASLVVETEEFWEENYLSTDARIPVTMTETNSARAMATNALTGHVWEDFASNTFKDLPSVGSIQYRDPFTGANNQFEAPAGGPGYYRVPTLIGAWATAPFLHNNSLGNFNNDPTVEGRLSVFDDAIEKLLWPERRLEAPHDLAKLDNQNVRLTQELQKDGGLIWRTSERTSFRIRGHQVPGFISGFTGLKPFWVRLIPWIPSLIFLAIGLFLILGRGLQSRFEQVGQRIPQLQNLFVPLRVVSSFVLLAVGLLLAYVLWKYFSTFRMVEVGSGWSLPWISLQVAIISAAFIFLALYLFFRGVPFSFVSGLLLLVASIFFALGLGRFASGNGGDLAIGPFPKNMPVNLVVNISADAPLSDLAKAAHALTAHFKAYHRSDANDPQELIDFQENVAPHLLKVSNCPDMVLDRGHDYRFIQHLSDDEKRELALLIKTF